MKKLKFRLTGNRKVSHVLLVGKNIRKVSPASQAPGVKEVQDPAQAWRLQ